MRFLFAPPLKHKPVAIGAGVDSSESFVKWLHRCSKQLEDLFAATNFCIALLNTNLRICLWNKDVCSKTVKLIVGTRHQLVICLGDPGKAFLSYRSPVAPNSPRHDGFFHSPDNIEPWVWISLLELEQTRSDDSVRSALEKLSVEIRCCWTSVLNGLYFARTEAVTTTRPESPKVQEHGALVSIKQILWCIFDLKFASGLHMSAQTLWFRQEFVAPGTTWQKEEGSGKLTWFSACAHVCIFLSSLF